MKESPFFSFDIMVRILNKVSIINHDCEVIWHESSKCWQQKWLDDALNTDYQTF